MEKKTLDTWNSKMVAIFQDGRQTLIYEFRFTQIVFFCFVQHFQLLMLNYHFKVAVIFF